MPATNSPTVPVGCRGTRRPLHVMTWREAVIPVIFTCSRSTEESTYRTVPPAPASSPITCHGAVQREPELQVRREPRALQSVSAPLEVGQDIVEVLGHEMRQHEAVVQF